MKTRIDERDEKVALDPDLRAFLKECFSCQSLAISAWAARILRAGAITMKDLERCLNLGFEI
ncbi:MAG: hypothetical protein B6D36_06850 [Planctomycetes bacterium UTPLA1]|jgi:hypothetical protein|nr:MAG: hypothetical protein B6D36_06850 [Planctomycetes bacterium UTPLA1]